MLFLFIYVCWSMKVEFDTQLIWIKGNCVNTIFEIKMTWAAFWDLRLQLTVFIIWFIVIFFIGCSLQHFVDKPTAKDNSYQNCAVDSQVSKKCTRSLFYLLLTLQITCRVAPFFKRGPTAIIIKHIKPKKNELFER